VPTYYAAVLLTFERGEHWHTGYMHTHFGFLLYAFSFFVLRAHTGQRNGRTDARTDRQDRNAAYYDGRVLLHVFTLNPDLDPFSKSST